MNKTTISVLAMVASLSVAGGALAQASGGPDAKGNAPLKPAHTVNDGAPKRGANSFTEAQAMQHIEKSGFSSVTGLAKGDDGVWRGTAMRDGRSVDVAMDFKGNVSTPAATAGVTATSGRQLSTPGAATSAAAQTSGATSPTVHHHLRRRHHHHVSCANPSANGAACSGVDRNHNGISDKEDRAIQNGARP